jgi:UDPglucose 6-dehydrogenase
MKISVVGLGKLGSPLAAVFAAKGFEVIGNDVNTAFVDAINVGRAPVDEPRLQELIDASRGRLIATMDTTTAVSQTDVTFIIVPTPSDREGHFSNEYALRAMASVGDGLRQKRGYHLVVMTSTVMPGSTGGELRAILEKHSGREVGPALGLCYNPEFIALGSVVRDMLRPDMILIGESDAHAGQMLEDLYRRTCENQPAVRRMNFVNAELTKISVNAFVTTKISYANMLADICERLPGADVDVVTHAVGADSRIGSKYLRGAIGYGGPCFPRDNVAFAALARSLGARPEIAEATDQINHYQVDRILGAIRSRLNPGSTVGILGFAYKPDTVVIEESQGVALAERLLNQGYVVVGYDPKALEAAATKLGNRLQRASSAERCVTAADLVVVMTPWPEFGALSASTFARVAQRMTVIDCWRVLQTEAVQPVADVVHVGVGPQAVAASVV